MGVHFSCESIPSRPCTFGYCEVHLQQLSSFPLCNSQRKPARHPLVPSTVALAIHALPPLMPSLSCMRCGHSVRFCPCCGCPLLSAAAEPDAAPSTVKPDGHSPAPVPSWMWCCGLPKSATLSAFDVFSYAIDHPAECVTLGVPPLPCGATATRRTVAEWWLRTASEVRTACEDAAFAWAAHWQSLGRHMAVPTDVELPTVAPKRQRRCGGAKTSYHLYRSAHKGCFRSAAEAAAAWHALSAEEKAPFDTAAATLRTSQFLTALKEVGSHPYS